MEKNLAWDLFSKTGSIDCYLLYKQSLNVKENSDEYGYNQDQRCGDSQNQG